MGAAKKLIDKKVLRDLVPINALSATHIDEISRKALIEDIKANSYVFKIGERDNQTVYLLEGEIEFLDVARNIVDTLRAGSEQARHPLAHKQPRQLGARAKGKITVARVDTSLLDVLLTWDESAGYDVVEIDSQDDGDWMTRMLQSQAFLQLPPANIHQLLMRLESISVSAGESIVRQGDEGDYFYIVKSGRLAVTRKPSAHGKEVLLAELGEGACFGEEALVSGTRRNASVMMITDGSLMRLSQNDFNELLRAPLVHELDYASASEMVAKGARWLDVRLPGEFENRSIVGSLNLPLSALREQCAELDDSMDYIVCCDTGRRSAAGAFVLSQRGFGVYTLKNGLMDVPEHALSAPNRDPAASSGRAADIIPFEGDSSATQTPASGKKPAADAEAVDSELIDKLVAAESDRANLQQEVVRLEAKLGELQAEIGRISDEKGNPATDEALNQAHRQLDETRERLENALQERDRQLHGLQQELERLREDYRQLGQRTSAVAGERDAMGRDLQQVRAELENLRQQHLNDSQERRAASERLQKALAEQEQALVAREQEASSLRQELETSKHLGQELERKLTQADARIESVQAENAQLEAQARGCEQDQAGVALELRNAVAKIEALEASLQIAQTERDESAQQLEQAAAREQSLHGRLQELEQHDQARDGQWRQQLDTANERIAGLEEELGAARRAAGDDAQRGAELEQQLAELTREHQSELLNTRNALSRAKTETDNLKREHSRVMESLRQTERKLQQQRQDHESELYRLRKELKEAAGASDAGLSAELELLEEKLRESLQLREELEVQLGERSAQLEYSRLASGKLEMQLQQAQESARQAEQQLLETNQAANEEMSTRLQAEERSRQALRDELNTAIEQRNRSQEQLTVQQQELEELRLSVAAARQELAAHTSSSEQDLVALRRECEQAQAREQQWEQEREVAEQHEQSLRRELEDAREQQQTLQRTLDQLRAEAEVTRGLVDMQVGAGDENLREQLQQAKQNVEVAVRLRAQAEEKNAQLEAEIDRLREALQAVASSAKPVVIPSLDPDDPQAAVRVDPADMTAAAVVEAGPASIPQAGPAPPTASAGADRPSMLGRLLAGALLGAAVAGGATWWWLTQMTPAGPASGARAPEAEQLQSRGDEAVPASPDSDKNRPQSGSASIPSRQEERQAFDPVARTSTPDAANEAPDPPRQERSESPPLPDFVKGGTGLPKQKPAAAAVDEAPPAASMATESPVPETVTVTPLKPKPQQPLRLFSQPLTVGGRGPTLVEFRADSFEMGSAASSANFDERPRHRVTLKAFAIGAREVTFADYDRFARATGRVLPGDNGWGRGERPVINVSWNDAVAYTHWLSQQTGSHYRLPSEAQWEFAARAGGDARFWWGNEVGAGNANCFDCDSKWSARKTAPVGSFAANAFRLHDTAGNVMEWVRDCYQSDYSAVPSDGSAVQSGDCGRRVVRGGAYDSPSANIRSASRDARSADTRLDNLGFRVVKE